MAVFKTRAMMLPYLLLTALQLLPCRSSPLRGSRDPVRELHLDERVEVEKSPIERDVSLGVSSYPTVVSLHDPISAKMGTHTS